MYVGHFFGSLALMFYSRVDNSRDERKMEEMDGCVSRWEFLIDKDLYFIALRFLASFQYCD